MPQLSATMRNMSEEMMKVNTEASLSPNLSLIVAHHQAGIITEMMDETMESLDDNEDELEEEAQDEVDKVLWQITDGKLGQASGKLGALPARNAATEEEDRQKDEEMERAIAGLLA